MENHELGFNIFRGCSFGRGFRQSYFESATITWIWLKRPGTGSEQANIKAFFNNPGGSLPEESEDCLYLNVYAPLGASPSTKKSVLVWLFGVTLSMCDPKPQT
jgi:carboxylesterase type B